MSSLNSPVETIDNLWIDKWPNKKIFAPVKVVRCDDVTVMKLKDGHRLYCDRIENHLSYSATNFRFNHGLMKCLLQLKIITKEQMNQHLQYVKDYELKRDREYARTELERLNKKYSLKITAKQFRTLGGVKEVKK